MPTLLPPLPTRRLAVRGIAAFTAGMSAATLLATVGLTPAAPAQSKDGQIRISGSSTVFPITTAAIASFRRTNAGRAVRFDLQETGTSAGFREFCSGAVPISNASRPINTQELKACTARGIRFIELPIAFDAITVAVNPRNDWVSAISLKELSRLWNKQAQGTVMRWNQVNIDWPARPIRLCGPGQDSGTYEYFNKAINGSAGNSRRDVTTSEDDAVLVRCVASQPNALGYFGFGWYSANRHRLRALAVAGPRGPVLPSLETVQKEQYTPLSRPLFLYVNNQAMLSRADVRRFVTHYVKTGPKLVAEARFIPLPSTTYRLVETKLYRHVLGTSFGGDLPVGLTISQALARSFRELRQPQAR